MKRLLPIGLIALISFCANAVPAKKGVRTFTQSDGSTISLLLVGDENFHVLTTTDGLAVSKGADGNYYYRTADSQTKIVAHNVEARNSAELSFINNNVENMSVQAVAKAAQSKGTVRKAPKRGVAQRTNTMLKSGSPKIPILLVQYSDYKFKDTDPAATFKSFYSEGSTSCHQYFYDQSNGKYSPQFDVYGPVTLSGTRATYGGNDNYGNDVGVGKMVAEACKLLDGSLDFSQYDCNGDNECDVVIVLYAGDGEASSYEDDAEDSVWPCQWYLSESDYGQYLTLDNTKVDKFAVFNELNGSDLTKIDGIGTFCHEFSHCLDLPDFYDTNYSGYFGMADWSLLDSGCYNNDGYTPIGYSAYEKSFMGWIDLTEGAENTQYTLPIFNQKNISTDVAIKLTNENDANEYYILENRARQGWDAYMPAEGMLITHVTYKASAWTGNEVNNYDLQRMTIIPADNNLKMNSYKYYGQTYYYADTTSLKGDLWPYGNAKELTNTSTPAAKVNTGTYMNKPVTEIVKNTDGTVSFWVMKTPLPSVGVPSNVSHVVNSSTSATIKWDAVDDADITYTVEVTKHKDIKYELVNSTNFNEDNSWTTSGVNSLSGGDKYLGSGKKTGYVISPQFTTNDEGIVTVIFNAKYYGTDKSSVKVSLLNGAGSSTIDTKTIALTDSYADYAVVFDGTANTAVKIKFETLAAGKRVYLYSADIYNGDASSLVETSTTAARAASEKKTFSGLTETSITVSDLEENGTYDYRVKAVPNDTEKYSESAWTEYGQFTLSESSAVTTPEIDNLMPTEYYNLQGVKLSGTPTVPGLYIIKTGSKTSKVLIK
jgi:M6 family metalloprotease-like protein